MSLQLPCRFGKYELVELIARGGMAEVYRARTIGIGGFEKWVAIKKVLPHLSENKEYMTMLIDEAKISVALTHANIAQVLDLGRIGESYYIAMEYVHGMDLATILKTCEYNNFTIPFEHTVHVAMQVCAGLYHAHSKADESGTNLGIIHRDVSPHNVLISYDGEVKVIDFGVAKASVKMTQTMSGIIKGKLLYMAPEQAMAKPLDGRADLFAVGLVLYKMTTGRLPFEGDNEFQVYNKLVAGKVSAPRRLNPAIPEDLDRVLMKVLSRKPSDRQPDALGLRSELATVLQRLDPGYTSSRLARFMETYFSPRPLSSGESKAVKVDPAPPQEVATTPEGQSPATEADPPPPPAVAETLPATPSQPAAPPPLPPSIAAAPAEEAPPSLGDADPTHPRPTVTPVPAASSPPPPPLPPTAPAPDASAPNNEPTLQVQAMPDLLDPTGEVHDATTNPMMVVPTGPPRRIGRSLAIVAGFLLLIGGFAAGAHLYLQDVDPRGVGALLEPDRAVASTGPAATATPTPSGAAEAPPEEPEPTVEETLAAERRKTKRAARRAAKMEPKEGEIAVALSSTPEGAEVYAGDAYVGKTPVHLILKKKKGGKRRYEIRMEGYKTAKKSIPMDKTAEVKVRLKKKRR